MVYLIDITMAGISTKAFNTRKEALDSSTEKIAVVVNEKKFPVLFSLWKEAIAGNRQAQSELVYRHLRFGNRKLPKKTTIFNFGSALECPSKKLGLCKVSDKCYARKAEVFYPPSLPFRKRQRFIWEHFNGAFADGVSLAIERKNITALRFSESGDFQDQKHVNMFARQCKKIKQKHPNLKIYGYTARKDLNFKPLDDIGVVVRGSGFESPYTYPFNAVESPSDSKTVCKGNCNICNLCVAYKGEIQIKFH